MSRTEMRRARQGVYVKPTQSRTSILKSLKAKGVKAKPGTSITSLLKTGAELAGAFGVPGAGLIGTALGAVGGLMGAAPTARARKTYQAQIVAGRIREVLPGVGGQVTYGRTLGYTKKTAKKMFGRRRRKRWTTRDEKEWEYKLQIAKVSQPVIVK